MKKLLLIGLMLVGANVGLTYGQVVIGAPGVPAEGALLDLKEKSGEASSTKGFLMPRVTLTDLTKLTPLVKVENDANKVEHKGLQIYHVGGNNIAEGLKIWNGSKWDEIFSSPKGQWVYMPPFPLKMYLDTEQTIDLYTEYSRQINGKAPLWGPNEVTFIITGVDSIAFATQPTIVKNTSAPTHTHTLKFKADVGKLTAASYLNIIIVKN
ncbi:hypothetical protein HX017_01385 [Myroides marinus]|uniref:hypothetical protein n=1 Tax=Myroides marinus TaxID=703342 RepID=UPI0025766686|nr:hypothetical protein [Myroides marinus]MDM1345776.1 hypothetical protein [Myroides marinus]MDM1349363.1 hypothetical protein [Myroides marinus]MDM1352959.1 hypothetical protein [Myroides marinus]MDM1356573.1 hypothetical protein [Myroides marinus]MDM1360933.1 hypothetical protein [Myroides marinus]